MKCCPHNQPGMLSTPASTLLDDVSCTFLSMSGDVMLAETQYIFAMAVNVPDVLAALCLQRGLSHDIYCASEVSVYTPGRISMVHACWSASRAVESHELIFGPTVELAFASSSSSTSSELMHSRVYSSPSSLLCHADVCFLRAA